MYYIRLSYDKKHFTYNPIKDEYICPANQPVTFLGNTFDKQKQKKIRTYKAQACPICPHQSLCTKRKDDIKATAAKTLYEKKHRCSYCGLKAPRDYMVKTPESMEDLVYFTRRNLPNNGSVMAWVYRKDCPNCGKSVMGKPKDKKGKVKTRAEEYVCDSCSYTVEKEEYDEKLTCEIEYVCPHCGNKGEKKVPFKKKKVRVVNETTGKKKSVSAVRFECDSCRESIDITKKMK